MLDLIPPRGPARRLVALTLVQAAAHGLFLTSSVVFFVRVVGLLPAEVGLGLSVAGLVGLLATVPVGRLADRHGASRLLGADYAALALLFAAYPLVRGLEAFVVVASLISVGEMAGTALRATVVHTLFPPKEALRTRAQIRSGYNVGFMAGAAVAALALASPGQAAFWAVCGGTALAQGLCVAVVRGLPAAGAAAASAGAQPRIGGALRDGLYVAVSAGNGLLEMHATLLIVGVPLWIVSHTSASASLASAVIVTNTVIVVLLQARASRGAETVRGSARLLRRAGLLLAAGCLVCAASQGAGPLTAAVVVLAGATVLTFGEIAQAAGGWGLASELAAPGRQGEYQGVFALGQGMQQVLGPLVVTTLLVDVGTLGWLILAATFAVTGLGVHTLATGGARRRASAAIPAGHR